jgi:membrane protein implicated in regulation of membrane protease activity
MSRTPALVLIGLLLVLLAIPLAFSLAPFVVGVIVLIVAGRRAHRDLADPLADASAATAAV